MRSELSGPSSGISTACAEVRADLSVVAEDLRGEAVFAERVERVDERPGISAGFRGQDVVMVVMADDNAEGCLLCFFHNRTSALAERKHVP